MPDPAADALAQSYRRRSSGAADPETAALVASYQARPAPATTDPDVAALAASYQAKQGSPAPVDSSLIKAARVAAGIHDYVPNTPSPVALTDPAYADAAYGEADKLPENQQAAEYKKINAALKGVNVTDRLASNATEEVSAAAPEEGSRIRDALERARSMGMTADLAGDALAAAKATSLGHKVALGAKAVSYGGKGLMDLLDVPGHVVRSATMPGNGPLGLDWHPIDNWDAATPEHWNEAIEAHTAARDQAPPPTAARGRNGERVGGFDLPSMIVHGSDAVAQTVGAPIAGAAAVAGQAFDNTVGHAGTEEMVPARPSFRGLTEPAHVARRGALDLGKMASDYQGATQVVSRLARQVTLDPLSWVTPADALEGALKLPSTAAPLAAGAGRAATALHYAKEAATDLHPANIWDTVRETPGVGPAVALGGRALGMPLAAGLSLQEGVEGFRGAKAAQVAGRAAGAGFRTAQLHRAAEDVAPAIREAGGRDAFGRILERTADPAYFGEGSNEYRAAIARGQAPLPVQAFERLDGGTAERLVPGLSHESAANLSQTQKESLAKWIGYQNQHGDELRAAGVDIGRGAENPLAADDIARALGIPKDWLPPVFVPRFANTLERNEVRAAQDAVGHLGGSPVARETIQGVRNGGLPLGMGAEGFTKYRSAVTDPIEMLARQAERGGNRVAIETTKQDLVRRGLARIPQPEELSAFNKELASIYVDGQRYVMNPDLYRAAMQPYLNKHLNTAMGAFRNGWGAGIDETPLGRKALDLGGATAAKLGGALKSQATVLRPGYYARNIPEDLLQGYAHGGLGFLTEIPNARRMLASDPSALSALDAARLARARSLNLASGAANQEMHGIDGATRALERAVNPDPGALRSAGRLAQDAIAAPSHVNESWRDALELAMFNARRKQGDTSEQAMQHALDAFIDYGDRSRTTQYARFAMPYATYMLKAPAMATQAAYRSPATVMAIPRLFDALGGERGYEPKQTTTEGGYTAHMSPRMQEMESAALQRMGGTGVPGGVQMSFRPPEPFASAFAPYGQLADGNEDPMLQGLYQHLRAPLEMEMGRRAVTKQDIDAKGANAFPSGMPGVPIWAQADSKTAPALLTQDALSYVPGLGHPLAMWAANKAMADAYGPDASRTQGWFGQSRPRSDDEANQLALQLQSLLFGISASETRPADILNTPLRRLGGPRASKLLQEAFKDKKAAMQSAK